MKRSTERILTTHAGSLPRPRAILELVEGRDQREVLAVPGADRLVDDAVKSAVRQQVEVGIDVLSDGEMGRVGFSSYATERLSGFDGSPRSMSVQVERALFPEFYAEMALPPARPSDEEYVFAAAAALANEYRAIVEAGFVVQLDDPGLAMGWNRAEFADRTLDDYRKVVAQHVEAINLALRGIPAERVRLHVCWGNAEWPHVRDIPLVEIVEILFRANAQAIYVEGANPRHGHEWRVFEDHPLPEGKVLIPGVIDTVTNFVEHPDLVADRIVRYAGVVGKENVIAGTDCGFGTFARSQPRVHPTVAWAKLKTLAEGARRASVQLWKSG